MYGLVFVKKKKETKLLFINVIGRYNYRDLDMLAEVHDRCWEISFTI